MKILVLSNYGMGLYKFRKEFLETLCDNNEVYIAVPGSDFTNKLTKIGCNYIPIEFNRRGTNPFQDAGLLFRYIKIVKEVDPDIVLTYTIKPNVYGGIACQMLKKPYISNITGLGTSIQNGGFISFVSRTLYKVGLRKANCVFFQNKDNQKLFADKNINKNKSIVLPGSGVNLQYHHLTEYPSEENGISFLFIGRIMKDKGIEELLKAIRTIHSKYQNTKLDIVGGYDENYIDELEKEDIKDYVKYYGEQDDVRKFIIKSHCVVLPTYHEGTANVLLEASATGRPVIATLIPGCKETFENNITGFGCEVRDVDSLVEAMDKFINLPLDKKKEMGLLARDKIEKEYDRNIVINEYCKQIENITGKNI